MLQYQHEINTSCNNRHDPKIMFTKHVNILGYNTRKQIVNAPEMGFFNKEVDIEVPIIIDAIDKIDEKIDYTILTYQLFELGKININELYIDNVDTNDTLVAIWLNWNDGEYGMVPYSLNNEIKFANNAIILKLEKHNYIKSHIGVKLYYTKKSSDQIPNLKFIESNLHALENGETQVLDFLYDTKNLLTLKDNEFTIGQNRLPKIVYHELCEPIEEFKENFENKEICEETNNLP